MKNEKHPTTKPGKRPAGAKNPGRRRTKGKARLFKFREDLGDFLVRQASKNKITYTAQLERWIEEKKRFKDGVHPAEAA